MISLRNVMENNGQLRKKSMNVAKGLSLGPVDFMVCICERFLIILKRRDY